MPSIFIVFGESGKWDSYEKHVVAVFTNKSSAIDWATKAQEKVDALYAKLSIYKDLDVPDEADDKPFDWFDLTGPPKEDLEFYSDMSDLVSEEQDRATQEALDIEWRALRLEAAKRANPYDIDMMVDRYTTTQYYVGEFTLDPSV